ncbi:MAG: hypothetical protein LBD50_01100 [Rickettsiales bacterium]|jgi:hypothetical protein|nr:hypothetical protein [Rickettsiales bacterium]
MKKRTKILWKLYLTQTVLTTALSVGTVFGINRNTEQTYSLQDYVTVMDVNDTTTSLQKEILSLSPEKLSELRTLYEETYALPDSVVVLDVKDKTPFRDLIDIDTQIKWRNTGDVALRNDTIYMQNKDIIATRRRSGFAYRNIPQINIYYFKYDGEIEFLKNIAKKSNSENIRIENIFHELQHIKHFKHIINTPKDQRTRSVSAANELFATIAGNLKDYGELKSQSKEWNKSFRTKVNVNDINYVLQQNYQPIIDSAIIAALDKLENYASYRKNFIEESGMEYLPDLESHYKEKTNTESDAIRQMQSDFKVNGKLTDILSLASKKVRQRAEKFIKSEDKDMQLVIHAHENNIKF